MRNDFPVEYERGYTKFLNCKIDLKNRVFIPRIETEFWVKKAINEIQNAKSKRQNYRLKSKILDIFTGSGCIGIAILKNINNSLVDFVDVDKGAIEQIIINLKLNKIPTRRYKICCSNLFEKIKSKYDVIFANPPYAALERIKEVQMSVLKYEPRRAIMGGKKGMYYIKIFLKQAKNFLKPKGIIYLEFDPQQKEDIKKIIEKEGYKKAYFFKDQFDKYRFAKVEKSR